MAAPATARRQFYVTRHAGYLAVERGSSGGRVAIRIPWTRVHQHACNVTVSLALWALLIRLGMLVCGARL